MPYMSNTILVLPVIFLIDKELALVLTFVWNSDHPCVFLSFKSLLSRTRDFEQMGQRPPASPLADSTEIYTIRLGFSTRITFLALPGLFEPAFQPLLAFTAFVSVQMLMAKFTNL